MCVNALTKRRGMQIFEITFPGKFSIADSFGNFFCKIYYRNIIMVGNLMQKIFTLINYLFIDFRARKLPALAGRGIAHPPLLKDFS